MKKHLSNQKIQAFMDGSMSPAELLSVDDHIQRCAECRKRAQDRTRNQNLSASLSVQLFEREPEHPSLEQLQLFVEAKLDPVDHEIVESHSSFCSICAQEITELRKIQHAFSERKPLQFTKRAQFISVVRLLSVAAAIAFALFAGMQMFQEKFSSQQEPQYVETEPPSVSPQAPVLIALRDSIGTITMEESGLIRGLESLPPDSRRISERILKSQKLNRPAWLSDLKGADEVLMGPGASPKSFSVSGPAGTAVLSDSPFFEWNPLAGAVSSFVEVFDEQFQPVASSPPVRSTSWNYAGKLQRGKKYQWQITAEINGEKITSPQAPAPPAQFYVLDQKSAEQLTQIQKSSDSHFVRGIAYAEAGLVREAEKELQELARMNPDSELVAQLLRDLRQN